MRRNRQGQRQGVSPSPAGGEPGGTEALLARGRGWVQRRQQRPAQQPSQRESGAGPQSAATGPPAHGAGACAPGPARPAATAPGAEEEGRWGGAGSAQRPRLRGQSQGGSATLHRRAHASPRAIRLQQPGPRRQQQQPQHRRPLGLRPLCWESAGCCCSRRVRVQQLRAAEGSEMTVARVGGAGAPGGSSPARGCGGPPSLSRRAQRRPPLPERVEAGSSGHRARQKRPPIGGGQQRPVVRLLAEDP